MIDLTIFRFIRKNRRIKKHFFKINEKIKNSFLLEIRIGLRQ